MKVSELEGAELDYWVAKAEGHEIVLVPQRDVGGFKSPMIRGKGGFHGIPQYSREWRDGGPIIERERIELQYSMDAWLANTWPASPEESSYLWSGPTPLIAAMRCFVASKFGAEVAEETA